MCICPCDCYFLIVHAINIAFIKWYFKFPDKSFFLFIQLQAVDGDGQDLAPLTVTVTDVNDNNPVFINRK